MSKSATQSGVLKKRCDRERERERERALLPHKPSAVLLRLEVSGAREDLIQDSCVKGFGRNAFIRDIALLSLPLSSFSLLMCSHPFHQSYAAAAEEDLTVAVRGRSTVVLSPAQSHKGRYWPLALSYWPFYHGQYVKVKQ